MAFNIRTKIISITIVILFLGIFFCSAILNYIFTREHFNVLQTNSLILAHNLKFQLERLLQLGLNIDTIEGFDRQCKDLVTKYENISYAYVVNPKGKILFHYHKNQLSHKKVFEDPYINHPEILKNIDVMSQISRTTKIDGDLFSEVFIPVYDMSDSYIGAIGIGFPYKLIINKIKKLAVVSFLISIISLAIALFLLIFIISHSVTNPLKNLLYVIEEIRVKNILNKQVEITSNDEIGKLGLAFNNMIKELDENRKGLIEKNRIEKEMEIAKIIQTSILPKNYEIPGFKVSAFMKTAEEVGGDYYDIIKSSDDEYWVSIGDVTGHGVTAGLIMMMLQAVFSSSVNIDSDFKNSPDKVYNICNKIIYENLKNRMLLNQFITACFLKFTKNGLIEYSGAHEHILVFRSINNQVEIIETDGLWLGMLPDISTITKTNTIKLKQNDILMLYTDGLTQIKNSKNEQYTLERLAIFLKNNSNLDPEKITEKLNKEIEQFKSEQLDDISFVILKKE